MEIFNNNKTYDFMGKKVAFLTISGILIIASLVLLFTRGLNYGIDFVGGTIVQVKYEQAAPLDKIREVLENSKYAGSNVTEFGSADEITIRFTGTSSSVTNDVSDEMNKILEPTGKFEIRKNRYGWCKSWSRTKRKRYYGFDYGFIGYAYLYWIKI